MYQAQTQHPLASASERGEEEDTCMEWGEVQITLPAEAAQDLACRFSTVLRTAMRKAGAIITIEPPTAGDSSTVLIIEGTHTAIMRSHRHISLNSKPTKTKP